MSYLTSFASNPLALTRGTKGVSINTRKGAAQARLRALEAEAARKEAEAMEVEVELEMIEEFEAPRKTKTRKGRPGRSFKTVRKGRAAKAVILVGGNATPMMKTQTGATPDKRASFEEVQALREKWGADKRYRDRNPGPRVSLPGRESRKGPKPAAKVLARPSKNEWLRLQKLRQKLRNREEGWQQMLVFVKAKYGADLSTLTSAEWESKQLSPKRVKELGLKSPKLSKAMVALGVPPKEVSILLGTNYAKKGDSAATRVLSDQESCKEQGNSIHYSSCQATDPRAEWEGGDSYNRISQELGYMGTHLFLWVVGEPMSKNGEGFEARAKLRVMYEDRACKEVAGLYIDRPYGKHQLLLDNLDSLQAWWEDWCEAKGVPGLPILMPPVWNRDNGAGNDFQYMYGGRYPKKLYCPSAKGGYQDTLTHGLGGYDCFVDVTAKSKNLLMRAYTERSKFGGVYASPLTDVVYNPQKGEVKAPVVKLPSARPPVTELYRTGVTLIRNLFGPVERFQQGSSADGGNGFFWKAGKRFRYETLSVWDHHSRSRVYFLWEVEDMDNHTYVLNARYSYEGLDQFVENDCPELGLWAPSELPYRVKSWGLKVTLDLPEEGWAEAKTLQYYRDENGFHVAPHCHAENLSLEGWHCAVYLPYSAVEGGIEVDPWVTPDAYPGYHPAQELPWSYTEEGYLEVHSTVGDWGMAWEIAEHDA